MGLALLGAAGCHGNRTLAPAPPPPADAGVDASPPVDASVDAPALSPFAADAAPPPDEAPSGDTAGPRCWRGSQQPLVVCFGDDPAPYQQYLLPARDGGYPVGQCPSATDFFPGPQSEGCVWAGCGPADPAAIARSDAGAAAGDAAPSCCYWIARACGF